MSVVCDHFICKDDDKAGQKIRWTLVRFLEENSEFNDLLNHEKATVLSFLEKNGKMVITNGQLSVAIFNQMVFTARH